MRLSAYYLLVLVISVSYHTVNCLNILGVFPYEGKSHFFVFEPLLRALARKGHNLTVISHFPQKNATENYNDISLAGKSAVLQGVFPLERSFWTIISVSKFVVEYGSSNCKLMLEDEGVQDLWKSENKFDVVLMEQFNSDCALGVAHTLGAPVVALTSHMMMPWHYNRYGNGYNPSYMPAMFTSGGTKPNLYQRIERYLLDIYFNVLYKYYSQRVDENTLAKYFDGVPPLEKLAREIKFLLLYQNPVLTGSSMFPKNVKEVGGYHIAKPKELPKELKKFIDGATHGVIFISFGSMVRTDTIPKDKLDAIVEVISELPQRIVWKWDSDTLPGNPKNVYLSKWLPQNDILAHPNVIAFYSHCGMLGTTEAMYHGVPILGMPVFGDQPGNAAVIEESGLGVQMHVDELTKAFLLEKFKTILDPSFRSRVKYISKAWHDRPQSAMDSAVYWIEYAGRFKNISFKSPSLETPYYQILGLDVLLLFVALIISLTVLVQSFLSSKVKIQSSKKQN